MSILPFSPIGSDPVASNDESSNHELILQK
jgi:hypothetical protein